MSDEQVAPETRGVDVESLATVDLAREIEGMDGRQLRMRMVTIEPGGVFGPVHDHQGRPGTVYVLQGTITDHRDGVATDYGPGVGWPEDRTHDPLAREPGDDPGGGDLGRHRQHQLSGASVERSQDRRPLLEPVHGLADAPRGRHPGGRARLRQPVDVGPPLPDRRRLATGRSTRAG